MGTRRILVAEFKVALRHARAGADIAVATTDETGAYMFAKVPPGEYRVCWKGDGYRAACSDTTVPVDGYTAVAQEVTLVPMKADAFLYGRVRLENGLPCRFSNEFFGVERYATVEVIGSSGAAPAKPIRTNAAGDFVIPRPADKTARLRVACGPATAEAPATDDVRIGVAVPDVIRDRFRIGMVDGALRVVAPGKQLRLLAAVPSSAKVEWKSIGGVEDTLSSKGREALFRAPAEEGLYSVYALAEDGRGDIGLGRIDFVVGTSTPAAMRVATAFAGAAAPEVPPNGIEFLTKKQIGDDTTTNAYYKFIDPDEKRRTLGDWWVTVGFDGTGGGGVRVAYANANDLGFGRDMNCTERGNDVACYVTNYGAPVPPYAANADLAWNKTAPAGKTVAMEFSPIERLEGRGAVVKFFVFDGGDAASARITQVDLDQTYPKNVPQLCLHCHSGEYQPAKATPTFDEVNLKSSFREFDLASFVYPAAAPRASQEGDFYRIQMMVLKTKPSDAIVDLIAHWYESGTIADDTYVPAGWKGDANQIALYRNLVATSCRTCHIAFGGSRYNERSWMTYEQFRYQAGMIVPDVCQDFFMPHAKVTYDNFWTASPSRSQMLQNFASAGWPPVPPGTCP